MRVRTFLLQPSQSQHVKYLHRDAQFLMGRLARPAIKCQDVPESALAIEANGKQVRYLKIPADADKELTKIEFLKGGDFSIPLVFAVTVEFAGGGH
jgi:hypothetical protein